MPYPSNSYDAEAPVSPLREPAGRAAETQRKRIHIAAGHRQSRRVKAFEAETIFDRDLQFTVRDGATFYVDVFRPADETKAVPAILCWGPYGKADSSFKLSDFPFRAGVARSAVSDLQTWEGADPAYWCARGYAVVNIDIRGARNSEGVLHFWDRQQAHDGYDTIEWIAAQPWCNGRVGMAGNSWLAISQWFIAGERPPHLAAIAPWEGFCDFYRHCISRGGIPDPGFTRDVVAKLVGRHGFADPAAKLERDPLYIQGWEEYAAQVEMIDVPAYVVASWTNFLHSEGTLEAFSRLPGDRKWLRLHNAFEWSDFYAPTSVADLNQFFDRYLKGEENGWEKTPRTRLTMIDPGGNTVLERPEDAYPPSRFKTRVLHLRADGTLANEAEKTEGALRYDAHKREALRFVHVFETDTETCGPMRLTFDFELENAADADLFAAVGWIKQGGKRPAVRAMPLGTIGNGLTAVANRLNVSAVDILFWKGPVGRIRISRRRLDSERSSVTQPIHSFDRDEPLLPGQVVTVDIAIPAAGLRWRRGERMEITIAGHALSKIPIPNLEQPKLIEGGRHVIRLGQAHPATLSFHAAAFSD